LGSFGLEPLLLLWVKGGTGDMCLPVNAKSQGYPGIVFVLFNGQLMHLVGLQSPLLGGGGGELGEQASPSGLDFGLDVLLGERPLGGELVLQLQTSDFDLPLGLVLQNARVGLAGKGWPVVHRAGVSSGVRSAPGVLSERRQVALDEAVGAGATWRLQPNPIVRHDGQVKNDESD
jgi:hypothetical protein